jgi:capsule polysaccharide export protein KpsE/RkpR
MGSVRIENLSMNIPGSLSATSAPEATSLTAEQGQYNWVTNATLFWDNRRLFIYVVAAVFLLSIVTAVSLPKQYESGARLMPPEQSNNGAAMLAALVGKGTGTGGGASLAGLAGSLLGVKNNGALFVALLRSGTVRGHLIDRFNLQHVYHKRYRSDTAKRLGRETTIVEDTKSGVITIVVTDRSPYRARDLAQGYLDELNNLVAKVNTSSAHREREFIELRLKTVQRELQSAQLELSEFSSANATLDVKEQTKAMVDAGAKLQGQLIVAESELGSLQQIYGSGNVRVRAANARVAVLQHELELESGESGSGVGDGNSDASHPYPSLRKLPQLGVRWANLYRSVRIHETVFDLLSEEYETARIEEVKSVPTVSVIDTPEVPERKSAPHRILIVLLSTILSIVLTGIFLVLRRSWLVLDIDDARRILAVRVWKAVIGDRDLGLGWNRR